ncbi:MAG TPA: reverse transcriptase/maturase family protein [Patescibacteria group bacterium]|nr:reverse transcriptase/maturase family protein [Patescibacteria group bacterium]
MKIKLSHSYNDIIELNNLFSAWAEFLVGKSSKLDVQTFEMNLLDNITNLYDDLANKTYRHGGYHSFYINDPKRRHIRKAKVRDRLLHHAIYRLLYPFFERTFISDSYSCRLDKGVYKAIESFDVKSYGVSKNNTKTCWVLKCDIKKFFDSIDHKILLDILADYIPDQDIMWLLTNVIDSYHSEKKQHVGLPLGNLTSQLFANVYMNVFDQWAKHKFKAKHYFRYADDFVVFSRDKKWLDNIIEPMRVFLLNKLNLTLHPTKITLKTHASGVDFLGWVHFPDYKKLRVKTKQRMFRRISDQPLPVVLQSYLGLLNRGNTFKIKNDLLNIYWLFGRSF